MYSSSRNRIGTAPRVLPRLGQGLRFVAIVWSIAGAFLALHLGLPELTHRLLVAGWIPADLALPDRGAPTVAIACGATKELPELPTPDPAVARHARFASWKLGRELGFAAGLANLGRTPEQLAPLMRDAEALGVALGVPTPSLPEIRHTAYAFAEYQAFVRTDPHCVAAALAARFGEAAAHHYRFGLVVGYVIPARALQVGALFPAEIRHYGQLAEVPVALFQPLTQEVLPSPDGADRTQVLSGIIERLDEYLLAAE